MLNVVEFPQPNFRDVPAGLRLLADLMESGEVSPSSHAIVVSVDDNGGLDIYGYGEIGGTASEVGILQMAALDLMLARRGGE